MSAYDCQTLYDVAWNVAEKTLRQLADNGDSYAGNPDLRREIAEDVADRWRTAVENPYRSFRAAAENSRSSEVRRFPDLAEAAFTALAEEFRAMGVTEENQPW